MLAFAPGTRDASAGVLVRAMIEKLELNVAPKPLGASSSSNTYLRWKAADGRDFLFAVNADSSLRSGAD